MLRHRRTGDRQVGGQGRDGGRPAGERLKYPPASGIGQGGERGGWVSHD